MNVMSYFPSLVRQILQKAVQTMDFAGVRCAVDEEVARSVMNELNAMDKKEDATKNTEGLAVPEAAKEVICHVAL